MLRGYMRPLTTSATALPSGGRLFPRRFALVRHIDYTGVSGVGVVAYGVVFSDGQVALRWCSDHPATSLWNSIDDLLAVHGHGDGTSVQWIDDAADRLNEVAESISAPRGRRARAPAPPPPPPVEPPMTTPVANPTQESAADTRDSSTTEDSLPPWPARKYGTARTAEPLASDKAPNGAARSEDTPVPPQRRPGGRHRKRAEPSEESASRR
jgi:hypothetical protein